MKLIPGTEQALLDYLLERCDALMIESFGVGGLPDYEGSDFCGSLCRWTKRGKLVVLTTQVQNEGSDLGIYHVGHRLKGVPGVLEAFDMTTEAVTAKLMWILGQTRDMAEIQRLFYTPVAHDILWPAEC